MNSAVIDNMVDDILGTGQDSKQHTSVRIKNEIPALMPLLAPTSNRVKPMTVMNGGLPVIVEDPVRFRQDIQDLVMCTMTKKLFTEQQFEELQDHGTMIEVATAKQMMMACAGNLKSYQYFIDRVLGRPLNQTKQINMTMTYEQFVDSLDPNEEIRASEEF